MVLYVLEVKADFEEVESLKLPKGYEYCIDVQDSAGDDTRQGVYVTAANDEAIQGSRGRCNFQVKWVRDAKSTAFLSVVEELKGFALGTVSGTSNGHWAPLVAFECRGLEPKAFHPENGWTVVSTGGTVFDDVDLRDDWADYCDKGQVSVGVYALEARFVRR